MTNNEEKSIENFEAGKTVGVYYQTDENVFTKYALKAFVNVPENASTLDKLEAAFEATNSIDQPWFMNKDKVDRLMDERRLRSSMVGDVFMLNTPGGTQYWMVARVGFEKTMMTDWSPCFKPNLGGAAEKLQRAGG